MQGGGKDGNPSFDGYVSGHLSAGSSLGASVKLIIDTVKGTIHVTVSVSLKTDNMELDMFIDTGVGISDSSEQSSTVCTAGGNRIGGQLKVFLSKESGPFVATFQGVQDCTAGEAADTISGTVAAVSAEVKNVDDDVEDETQHKPVYTIVAHTTDFSIGGLAVKSPVLVMEGYAVEVPKGRKFAATDASEAKFIVKSMLSDVARTIKKTEIVETICHMHGFSYTDGGDAPKEVKTSKGNAGRYLFPAPPCDASMHSVKGHPNGDTPSKASAKKAGVNQSEVPTKAWLGTDEGENDLDIDDVDTVDKMAFHPKNATKPVSVNVSEPQKSKNDFCAFGKYLMKPTLNSGDILGLYPVASCPEEKTKKVESSLTKNHTATNLSDIAWFGSFHADFEFSQSMDLALPPVRIESALVSTWFRTSTPLLSFEEGGVVINASVSLEFGGGAISAKGEIVFSYPCIAPVVFSGLGSIKFSEEIDLGEVQLDASFFCNGMPEDERAGRVLKATAEIVSPVNISITTAGLTRLGAAEGKGQHENLGRQVNDVSELGSAGAGLSVTIQKATVSLVAMDNVDALTEFDDAVDTEKTTLPANIKTATLTGDLMAGFTLSAELNSDGDNAMDLSLSSDTKLWGNFTKVYGENLMIDFDFVNTFTIALNLTTI
jgi:hypothetical protein